MSSQETSKSKDTAFMEHVLVAGSASAIPEGTPTVQGYDFNSGPVDYDLLLRSFLTTGYQATNFGLAVEEVMRMLSWRASDEEAAKLFDADPVTYSSVEDAKDKAKCKIFLGYTSNMSSSGVCSFFFFPPFIFPKFMILFSKVRECIRFLCQHKLVDVVVSTAGGVEEDFIKCLAPTYLGDFALRGATLRSQGLNRIGNLLVPNDNYVKFEEWLIPILDQLHAEQETAGTVWTPSRIIDRLGKEIDNPESIYYWCHKNGIPVFCPALTDGSIGDMIYFHSYSVSPPLTVDIARDIRAINDQATRAAPHTGMLILGGGLVKHHICNANLMRNGADFAVLINTGQEFDGSDSGARPDEAISWGKIKIDAKPVKVYADATLIFPLLVAQTFAKHHLASQQPPQQSPP